jgi:glycosyltransferase involved in cell wall biosynthesis
MRTPLLSVILPVYNASAYIDEAIASILRQDFTDFELLIANDGSTDDSLEKIRKHVDARIIVSDHPTNQGLISTLNHLLTQAKGTYIARMDADDIARGDRFSRQVAFLNQHNEVGICGSAMEFFGAQSGRTHVSTQAKELHANLLFGTPFNHPTVMFRRSLIDNGSFFYDPEFRHAEDFELWSRLRSVTQFGNIDEPLLRYRLHADQVTQTQNSILIASVEKALARILDSLVNYTADELKLHLCLFRHKVETETVSIEACRDWLQKLIYTNDVEKIFPVPEFRKACGKMWFLVCTTQAGQGVDVQKFRSKILSESYQPSLARKIKFQLKQWRFR